MSVKVLYPGYNVDPRVKKVIDRCISIGMTDFYKPYSNKKQLFKFSTLERDRCTPARVKEGPTKVHESNPGLQLFKHQITKKPRALPK